MADFNITSPDGHKFKVTAPEGVTEDEILRRVTASKLPPSDPSFVQNLVAGFTAPVRGGAQLLHRLADPAGVTPESQPSPSPAGKVRQPEADPNSAAYVLGGMIGPMGAAGALSSVAPKIIGPLTKAAIAGGASAALQPVEDTDNFWTKKAEQTGEGLLLGYGLGWAGKGASAGIHALGDYLVRKYPENITTQAVNAVLKRIEQDSKYGAPTAQQALDLVEAASATGKPMTLTDVGGRNLKSLAGHVTRAPGESRQMAEAFFIPRDEAAAKRLKADIDKYVSNGVAHDTVEALLAGRSAAAKPLYGETDKLQKIWSPRLQEFLENPDVAKGMARGYHIERLNSLAEGRPFNPTMMGVDLDQEGNIKLIRTPNMRVLDMAKQGLDAMIAEQRNEITGRLSSLGVALDKVRRSYVKELDALDKNGVYKKARESWGGYSAALDAVRAGQTAFSNTPQENASLLNAATENEREFMRVGLADKLRERLGKTGFGADESKALIKNPWMRDQIMPFFKSEADFNRFVEAVTNENIMAQTKNRLLRGSETAERLAEDQSDTVGKIAGGARIARSLVEGNILRMAAEFWRMHRDATRKPDPAVNEAIAKIIFAPDIKQTDLGRRLLAGPGQQSVGAATAIANKAASGVSNVIAPALAAGVGAPGQ